jgi:small neutral amino acid transporter SnatA (MarC family)
MSWIGWMNVLLVAVGIIMIGIMMFKWNWYKINPRAKRFTKLVGETRAKMVYAIIGIVLIAMGVTPSRFDLCVRS